MFFKIWGYLIEKEIKMKVLHLLNWKLGTIEKELDNIGKQGFDAIQINPMQPFKEEKEFKWWSSYQPLGFRIGNMFGSCDDLRRLCSVASDKGIDVIVDVVLNHMANKSGEEPLVPHENVDRELVDIADFWKEKIMLKNGDDRFDAVNHCIGLPGLDLSNQELQKIVFRYLDELKECGVSGLRFDAAKHIGLPNDGVDFFKNVRQYMLINGMYGYGEFLGGTKEWRNEMAELLMVLSPHGTTIDDIDQMISFIESHDTYLNINDHDHSFKHTRCLTDNDLISNYMRIRQLYNNSLVYVRPNNENNPYCRNIDSLSCDDVYKLDERDYFTRLYFDSERIREINGLSQEDIKKISQNSDINSICYCKVLNRNHR